MIYSQELEVQILGGLLNSPERIIENNQVISEDDFYTDVHKIIYKISSNTVLNRGEINSVIIAEKVKALSIGYKENINILDYINTVMQQKPKNKVFDEAVKQLKLISARRTFHDIGQKISKKMLKDSDTDFNKMMSFVDGELNKGLNSFMGEDDTINLFSNLYDLIEERGNNPVDEVGFKTPFNEFNQSFGGCKIGDVYVWCARPGSGKSTLLNNMAFKMSNTGRDDKIPALIIDTEMGQEDAVDVKFRLAASISGINPWYFTTGNWRKSEEMVNIVRNPNFKKELNSYKLDYKFLPDASKEKLISTIKKWYYTKVGRGNPCIVVYDYIKFSGGDGGGSQDKEFQVIGEKVNALKELMGKEVRGPLLTAVQMNRQGESRSKNRSDDSSAIAISDRILWFATYVGIFRKKDADEITEEGIDYGTHKMIDLKCRFQGKNGYNEFVKSHKGETKYNFRNYRINNFNVHEVCGAEKMYEELDKKPKVMKKGDDDSTEQQSPI